ncbi:MAG: FAD-dependent thymidylate synthase, partial [archaeon]
MKVKLIKYTPNPEEVCAAAALGCHSEKPSSELIDDLTEEKKKEILRETVGRGHYSVIEHASFTFSIADVSRSLTHQLVR